jgi:hypothetical protein
LDRLQGEIDECLHPRRRMMPGRIECVEREAFARPVREQLDQPTIVQHVLDAKRQDPRNACTSRTGSQLGASTYRVNMYDITVGCLDAEVLIL